MKIELYHSPNSMSLFIRTSADAVKLAQALLRAATDPRDRAPSGDVMLTAIHNSRDGKSVTATLSARVNAKTKRG